MALPASLPSLTEREAITDTLYRAIVGIDTADKALFDSALADDGRIEISGHVMEGREAIHAGMFDFISTKLTTTHFLSNIRIDVKPGATTAKVTAQSLAQHCRPGDGTQPGAAKFLAGGMYFVDVAKDEKDGLWKVICHCKDCHKVFSLTGGVSIVVPADKVYLPHHRTPSSALADSSLDPKLQVISGTPKRFTRKGTSGKNVTYFSCPICPTVLFNEPEARPGMRVPNIGTLDDCEFLERCKPGAEIYAKDRVG
ncbi:Uu.00g052780.m01.CDS01 [Anthostomella pinea]|uniref:Uu.00g052780.m01.CDS01 n=1 Tax=Anthostomella pinea TaxID=933095 RepID=A0AAI8VWC7_9PEZI|nr:Uu.00g052780.m01.CDS01 [Anthostomella pinea]